VFKTCLAAVAATLTFGGSASAAVISHLYENGNDVIWSYSGDLDLATRSYGSAPTFTFNYINAGGGNLYNLNAGFSAMTIDTITKDGVALPAPQFGTSGNVVPPTLTAIGTTDFGVSLTNEVVYFDFGYTSGDAFFGELTYVNTSFADLGIGAVDEGIYVFEWSTGASTADTVTLNIGDTPGVTAVPLPPAAAGLGLGIWCLAGVRRRRRR
jgi:hypothetical protein